MVGIHVRIPYGVGCLVVMSRVLTQYSEAYKVLKSGCDFWSRCCWFLIKINVATDTSYVDVNRVNHVIKIAASNTAYYNITLGLDVKTPLCTSLCSHFPSSSDPYYVGMLFQILMTRPPGGPQTDKGKKELQTHIRVCRTMTQYRTKRKRYYTIHSSTIKKSQHRVCMHVLS